MDDMVKAKVPVSVNSCTVGNAARCPATTACAYVGSDIPGFGAVKLAWDYMFRRLAFWGSCDVHKLLKFLAVSGCY